KPTIDDADGVRGQAAHLANRALPCEHVRLADIVAEDARERAVLSRMSRGRASRATIAGDRRRRVLQEFHEIIFYAELQHGRAGVLCTCFRLIHHPEQHLTRALLRPLRLHVPDHRHEASTLSDLDGLGDPEVRAEVTLWR